MTEHKLPPFQALNEEPTYDWVIDDLEALSADLTIVRLGQYQTAVMLAAVLLRSLPGVVHDLLTAYRSAVRPIPDQDRDVLALAEQVVESFPNAWSQSRAMNAALEALRGTVDHEGTQEERSP